MIEQQLLKKGLESAPSIVAMIAIVIFFLRYLNEKDKRDIEKTKMVQEDFNKRDLALKEITSRAFQIHQESNKIIKENTEVIGEVKQVIRSCARGQSGREVIR